MCLNVINITFNMMMLCRYNHIHMVMVIMNDCIVSNVMAIHPEVVEIFRFEPRNINPLAPQEEK